MRERTVICNPESLATGRIRYCETTAVTGNEQLRKTERKIREEARNETKGGINVNIPIIINNNNNNTTLVYNFLWSTVDSLTVKGIPYCQFLIAHQRILKSPPMEVLTYTIKYSLQSEIFQSIILIKRQVNILVSYKPTCYSPPHTTLSQRKEWQVANEREESVVNQHNLFRKMLYSNGETTCFGL